MNFNFIKDFGKVGKTTKKFLSYGLMLMFVVFTSASLNSLHAQRSSNMLSVNSTQLETTTVRGIVDVLKNEVIYITDQINESPLTVDVDESSLFQVRIVAAYNDAIRNIARGGDVQSQMLNILQGPLFKSSSNSASKPLSLSPSQQQHLNNIIEFVQNWNLSNEDISDFIETVMMIRELEN